VNTSLVHVQLPLEEPPYVLTQAQAMLRQMVLDTVPSVHSKRNYAKALDDLFAFCASRPLCRALIMSTEPRSIIFLRPLLTYGYRRYES